MATTLTERKLWERIRKNFSWSKRIETGETGRGIPDVLTIIKNRIVFLELKVGDTPVFRPGQIGVGQRLDAASGAVVILATGTRYLACRYRDVGNNGDFSRAKELKKVDEEEIWNLITS